MLIPLSIHFSVSNLKYFEINLSSVNRVIFIGPSYFSIKKKTAKQPITAAVPVNPVIKKSNNWLLGGFLFGTEIGGYQ